MRKFKHKSGSTATYIDGVYQTDDGYVIPDWIVEESGDWQEITKDYKILGWNCNSGEKTITKVKRLSDGEVFGVSEDVEDGGKILKLKETNKGIIAECEYRSIWLRHLRKSRKPILITEGGVELFEGDKAFLLEKGTLKPAAEINITKRVNKHKAYIYFSTCEAAEEYRLNNARLLCLNDLEEDKPLRKLKNLVKSRLK